MEEQHLRNYKILKKLGEGGMATVYLAEHLDLGHKVAIKVLNKEFIYHSNLRNRFIDEAKKMVRMDHPNVVKVSDLINDPDQVAIVMEYVNGETLKDILLKKKLNDAEIGDYLNQMIAALDYVHSQGLVHRDIKPSNFIFNEKGVLKLTDFGISKSFDSALDGHTQTSTAMSMGTPMYMSPEQVKSTKDVTYLSDYYSLGVVLWEMAAGRKPYDLSNLSAFDLQLKIVQEDLPHTNTKWDAFIKNCCQKDESKRIKRISENSDFEPIGIKDKVLDKTIISTSIPPNPKEIKLKEENPKKNVVFYVLLVIVISGFVASFVLFLFDDSRKSNNVRNSINKIDYVIIDSSKTAKTNVLKNDEYKKIMDLDVQEKNNGNVNSKSILISESKYGKTEVLKVFRTPKYTVVRLKEVLNKKGYWISIDPNSYIFDKQNNEKHYLKNAYNIPLSPARKVSNYDYETIEFELYFSSVKSNCKSIDFIESTSSEWKFYNLKVLQDYSITDEYVEGKIFTGKIQDNSPNTTTEKSVSSEKVVDFHNLTTNERISISVCYWDGENWVNSGWYNVNPGKTYSYRLPSNYKHSSMYYYAFSPSYFWGGEKGSLKLCVDKQKAYEEKYDQFEFLQNPSGRCKDPVYFEQVKVSKNLTEVNFGD